MEILSGLVFLILAIVFLICHNVSCRDASGEGAGEDRSTVAIDDYVEGNDTQSGAMRVLTGLLVLLATILAYYVYRFRSWYSRIVRVGRQVDKLPGDKAHWLFGNLAEVDVKMLPTLSVSISISDFGLSVSGCLRLCLGNFLCIWLYLCRCLCLCICMCLSLSSLSIPVYVSGSVPVSVFEYPMSVSDSVYLGLSRNLCMYLSCVCLCLSPSVSVCLCLSVSLPLSVFVCLCLYLCLYFCSCLRL